MEAATRVALRTAARVWPEDPHGANKGQVEEEGDEEAQVVAVPAFRAKRRPEAQAEQLDMPLVQVIQHELTSASKSQGY